MVKDSMDFLLDMKRVQTEWTGKIERPDCTFIAENE